MTQACWIMIRERMFNGQFSAHTPAHLLEPGDVYRLFFEILLATCYTIRWSGLKIEMVSGAHQRICMLKFFIVGIGIVFKKNSGRIHLSIICIVSLSTG